MAKHLMGRMITMTFSFYTHWTVLTMIILSTFYKKKYTCPEMFALIKILISLYLPKPSIRSVKKSISIDRLFSTMNSTFFKISLCAYMQLDLWIWYLLFDQMKLYIKINSFIFSSMLTHNGRWRWMQTNSNRRLNDNKWAIEKKTLETSKYSD